MSEQESIVPRSVSIPIAMFAFFLIFSTVAGMIELLGEGPTEGEHAYALFSASASTVIFGLAASWLGPRLPAKWWGEAVLVAVIFYLIWLLMSAVGGTLDGEAFLSGALYAVIAAIISGIFFEISMKTSKK